MDRDCTWWKLSLPSKVSKLYPELHVIHSLSGQIEEGAD